MEKHLHVYEQGNIFTYRIIRTMIPFLCDEPVFGYEIARIVVEMKFYIFSSLFMCVVLISFGEIFLIFCTANK